MTVEDLPGAAANAYCNAFVRCGVVSDIATCRSLDFDLDFDPELTVAVNNGTVIFNEREAQLCLAGFGGSCESDRVLDANEHCDLAFEGTVHADGACAINEQCISGECNITSCPDACCPGTCVGDSPPIQLHEGDACFAAGSCIDSFCSSLSEMCEAFKNIGETCAGDEECERGYCEGVCTAYPIEGQPCVADSQESACGHIGLYCNPTTAVCTKYALDGDACSATVACSPAYQCTSGACELMSTLGDACNPQLRGCIDDSYCHPTTLHCTAPAPDGTACGDGTQCVGECDFDTMMCVSAPICI